MRLAYLVPNFPVLSETFVSSEIERLKARGIGVQVYAFSRPSLADIPTLDEGPRALMAETKYIGRREITAALARTPAALLRAWGENQRIQDAATVKPNAAARLLRAVAVASRMKADGIRHLHAHWPYATQVAHLVRLISGASYSISVHAHEVAHDNGHFPLVFEDLAFASFCNRGVMNHLLQALPPDAAARAHLVYHGVDIGAFPAAELPREAKPLRIISAGRLTPTKGFDRLIRACAAAKEAGVDVHLTILGRGAIDGQLRALAESLGFAGRLSLPGWVGHGEVRAYLSGAHVFALLADTGFHDGLPNVVLEAMACARPVILSPLPAAGEAVTHCVEGFVLNDPDDVSGFVSAVKCISKDPMLLVRMGEAARRRVATDHDADLQVEHLVRLFRGHVRG